MVRCSKARAMFAMRACRKSVMIGMPLTQQQMTSVSYPTWICHDTLSLNFLLPGSAPYGNHGSTLELSSWTTYDETSDRHEEIYSQDEGGCRLGLVWIMKTGTVNEPRNAVI